VATVPEHRKLVGDLEHLGHLVGNVDDALLLVLQLGDDAEEVVHLLLGNGGGRFVHNQNV
jgi:hypothetical protein